MIPVFGLASNKVHSNIAVPPSETVYVLEVFDVNSGLSVSESLKKYQYVDI